MAIGHITLYKWDKERKDWCIHKDYVSLRVADHDIKYARNHRIVAVHNGIVLAATDPDDLDLVFEDITYVTLS